MARCFANIQDKNLKYGKVTEKVFCVIEQRDQISARIAEPGV